MYVEGILHVMLRILDRYRSKQFVPRRILEMAINYITLGYPLHLSVYLLKACFTSLEYGQQTMNNNKWSK